MKNLYRSLSFAILSLVAVACKPADVKPRPIADFTYQVVSVSNVEKVIQLTNTSKNADRYQWTTPTGLGTTSANLNLSMTQNGRVSVSLTAKSDVGEDTKTESIEIAGLATTGNHIFFTNIPDKGDVSVYINNVLQGKISVYYTTGTPDCGQQGNVTVTLPPGTYNYTAQSQGLFPYNWSSTFTVVRGQCTQTKLIK